MTDELHPADTLSVLIQKAIADLEITTAEYQEILAQVSADGIIDPEEAKQLKELNKLIADGTVKRVDD